MTGRAQVRCCIEQVSAAPSSSAPNTFSHAQVAETLHAVVDIAAEHDAQGTAAILDELIRALAVRASKIISKQNRTTQVNAPLAL